MSVRELEAALYAAIMQARKPDPALHVAAKTGDFEKFHAEYVKTKDPKETDADGSTVMHHACWHEDSGILMFLINQQRSLIDEQDIMWNTPLHIAAKKGNLQAIELLKAAGASENAVDRLGRTYQEFLQNSTPPPSLPSSPPPQRSSRLRSLRKSVPETFNTLRRSIRRESAPPIIPEESSIDFRMLHQRFSPIPQDSVSSDFSQPLPVTRSRSVTLPPPPRPRNRSLSDRISQVASSALDRFKETTDLP